MRFSLGVSVFLALGCILPETFPLSIPPPDLEASGYDLDGSGSGDDPEQEWTDNNPDPAIAPKPSNGKTNTGKSSPMLNVANSYRNDGGSSAESVVISNSEGLLENKEITAAAIAGGITGLTIGLLLSAILIYKWRKKHKEDCALSQNKASEKDYRQPIREVAFI